MKYSAVDIASASGIEVQCFNPAVVNVFREINHIVGLYGRILLRVTGTQVGLKMNVLA
jgi:hypothetical protein